MNLLQMPIYHGFCYTHFNMKADKLLKVWNLDLQTLVWEAEKIQTLANTLNKAIEGGQLDKEYITGTIDIMAGFAINIIDEAHGIEVDSNDR